MGALIDSSVLVAADRGKFDLEATLAAQPPEEVFVLSALSASELLHGVHRADAAHRGPREAFVEALLVRLAVVPFDLTAARVHGRVWAELAAAGTNVGPHDLLIAATAMSRGYAVATRDLRSFPKIPGLKVLRW